MSVRKLALLEKYTPIHLHEIGEARLMKRTDTKYVFSVTLLPEILRQSVKSHQILEVDEHRVARYKTTYFDTPDFVLFHTHQNGKLCRNKVRVREYVLSGLKFLEIKQKTNKGITQKGRIEISDFDTPLNRTQIEFIASNIGSGDSLIPSTIVHCDRVTLVNRFQEERVTLDFNVLFENASGDIRPLTGIAIAEVKKSSENKKTTMQKTLLKNGVKQMSISKYCTGTWLLYPQVKQNNYKEKLRKISRIAQQK